MRDLFQKKLNISKGNFIAGLLIIGLVVMGGILLAHQNRYEPDNQIKNLSASRSQVYIKGKGYKLDKKQLSEHEKIEKARENLLKKSRIKSGQVRIKRAAAIGLRLRNQEKGVPQSLQTGEHLILPEVGMEIKVRRLIPRILL